MRIPRDCFPTNLWLRGLASPFNFLETLENKTFWRIWGDKIGFIFLEWMSYILASDMQV